MTTFILAALAITAVALLVMLRPLYKSRNTVSFERQAQNIHFAKERLTELELQLKNASINATDYEALKLEIESTLADDIDLAEKSQSSDTPEIVEGSVGKRNTSLIAIIVITLPLAGLASYWWLGTPVVFSEQTKQTEVESQNIQAMVASVEARLADNPEDVQGWTVLSRTYLSLGRYQDAKQGFLKLVELQGETADTLTSLADASALLAGGDMQGEPTSYVERALSLQPNHPQALWLAGLSAAQAGNPQQAQQYWNRLLPLLEGNPQQQQELAEIIQQSLAEQGMETADKDETAESHNTSEGAKSSGLSLIVSLDPKIEQSVSANDIVFVFARAKQGPPAPLAVKRLKVSDLPAQVTLNDADAMMPQFKLSLFDKVVVNARIAKSGNPIAQPGDLQSSEVDTVTNHDEKISLVISEIVD